MALFPAADIPLGSAFEYFSRPLVLDAVAVYQQALAKGSPLTLLQKYPFAKDVLERAQRVAPHPLPGARAERGGRLKIRVTFGD